MEKFSDKEENKKSLKINQKGIHTDICPLMPTVLLKVNVRTANYFTESSLNNILHIHVYAVVYRSTHTHTSTDIYTHTRTRHIYKLHDKRLKFGRWNQDWNRKWK